MSTASERSDPEPADPGSAAGDAGARAPCDVTIVAHHIGPVGGMERQISELIGGLRRRGHRVTVIAYECELDEGPGVTFHRIRGPARPLVVSHPWFMLAATLTLRRRRRGVVQATGAIVLNRVDFVSVHYCHQVGPTNPSRLNWLFRLNARAAALLGIVAERICFRLNRPWRFLCVSDGVAEEMRAYFPAQAQNMITVHNGVDTEAFSPGTRARETAALRSALGIGQDRLVAIFVGGEWGRKGLEPAIRALPLAPGWDLLVVGPGERERYEQLAVREGVAEAVHWIGVSRDVALLYELADALVFPSSYEAFPLVVLEAAASGLPILATPVNGVRELVREGENGFLIERDPAVIAERLRWLAAEPQLRERLGREARAAAELFSWERMVSEHARLYEERASSSSARSRAPASSDQPG